VETHESPVARDEWIAAAAALLSLAEVGPRAISAILGCWPSEAALEAASEPELASVGRISLSAATAIRRAAEARRGRAEVVRARALGIRLLAIGDPGYPARLRDAEPPPPLLYLLGPIELPPPEVLAIAVIGTRRATPYGLETAERLGAELADAGAVVVSGFARGIDSAAHRGALDAGGSTIAVLGAGLDVSYPPENRRFAERMAREGLLVGEFSLGAPPIPENFPRRNRILAGLAHAVVVVEAAERSGALLTVEIALRLGRAVMAVPGPVTSRTSAGTFGLLRDGAKPVAGAEDVLEAFPLLRPPVGSGPRGRSPTPGTGERRILAELASEPGRAEDLGRALRLPLGRITHLLAEMEISRLVRSVPGGRYARTGRAPLPRRPASVPRRSGGNAAAPAARTTNRSKGEGSERDDAPTETGRSATAGTP
jgi:DNA processing protein